MSDVEAAGPDRPTEVRRSAEPVAPPSPVSAAPTPTAPSGTESPPSTAPTRPVPASPPSSAEQPATDTAGGGASGRRRRPCSGGPRRLPPRSSRPRWRCRCRGHRWRAGAGTEAADAGGPGDAACRDPLPGPPETPPFGAGSAGAAPSRRPHARAARPAQRGPGALGGGRDPGAGAPQAEDRRHDAGATASAGGTGRREAVGRGRRPVQRRQRPVRRCRRPVRRRGIPLER